jgi:hypothetical protein
MNEAKAPDRRAEERAERAKAATRKLYARLRSIEAIVSGDLRKRGNQALTLAAERWYAEGISATADDKSIMARARDVLAAL